MFCVIYRWTIAADKTELFERAWRDGTVAIRRDLGGLGSRLHRSAPGEYFAYAQWPDEATFRAARERKMAYDDPVARQAFLDALDGSSTEIVLAGEVADDLLVSTPPVE